jgi:hypothetical protein
MKSRNTVVIKAGMLSGENKPKYKIGRALRESRLDGIPGYVVELADGTEKFYFKEQVTFMRTYIRKINDLKKELLILEKAGLSNLVEDSFKSLCTLEEELSHD